VPILKGSASIISEFSEFLLDVSVFLFVSVSVFLFVLDGPPGQKDFSTLFFPSLRQRRAVSKNLFSLSFGILSKRKKTKKVVSVVVSLVGPREERRKVSSEEKEGKFGFRFPFLTQKRG